MHKAPDGDGSPLIHDCSPSELKAYVLDLVRGLVSLAEAIPDEPLAQGLRDVLTLKNVSTDGHTG